MANDKLQELTELLYKEGLSKGRDEGDRILSEAKSKAEQIVREAEAKAGKTIDEAQKKAAEMLSKAQSDVKMASQQALSATKSDIQNVILAKTVNNGVRNVLGNEEFLKEIISGIARNFSSETASDISLTVPEGVSASLREFLSSELAESVGRGIQVETSKKIKGGFEISPKDGGYFISLSDETFNELIKEYLRPSTRKILFGE